MGYDLGHPPFGHAGEDELEQSHVRVGRIRPQHVQTFRVLTSLERRYPAFDGLNLTWETLEGVVKHNGAVTGALEQPSWKAVIDFNAAWDLGLDSWPSAEAQAAAIADDIAYNNHDVDDGLDARLFTLDELREVPLIGPILSGVMADYPALDARMTRLEAVRRMIGAMVDDVLAQTRARVAASSVDSPDAVRALGHPIVAFSETMAEDLARLRAFLHERMYRHWRVNRSRSQARRILAGMFALFMDEPDVLPADWYARLRELDEAGRARVVCDYIAGMTDRFAIEEHRRLFTLDPWGSGIRG